MQLAAWIYLSAIALAALLPRIKAPRGGCSAPLRRGELTTSVSTQIPFELRGDLAVYRTLSGLAGEQEAWRPQVGFDRHATVLADRRKLLAFLLLSPD
ncbi:MAG: hypothetical protein ABI678_07360 [Kofleriaceae bacterium]